MKTQSSSDIKTPKDPGSLDFLVREEDPVTGRHVRNITEDLQDLKREVDAAITVLILILAVLLAHVVHHW
jgi:hypothetical protein